MPEEKGLLTAWSALFASTRRLISALRVLSSFDMASRIAKRRPSSPSRLCLASHSICFSNPCILSLNTASLDLVDWPLNDISPLPRAHLLCDRGSIATRLRGPPNTWGPLSRTCAVHSPCRKSMTKAGELHAANVVALNFTWIQSMTDQVTNEVVSIKIIESSTFCQCEQRPL